MSIKTKQQIDELVKTVDEMMIEIASIFNKKKVSMKHIKAVAEYYKKILAILEELR